MIISQIRLKSNFTITLFENFLKSNSVLNYHLVNVPIFLPFLLFLKTQFCSKLQCLKRFNLRPGRLYPNILSYICKLLSDTIIVDIRRRRCGNRCTLDVSERLRRSIIVSRSSSIRLLVGNSNDPESGTGRVTYMLAERIPRNVWVITKPPSISLSFSLRICLCLCVSPSFPASPGWVRIYIGDDYPDFHCVGNLLLVHYVIEITLSTFTPPLRRNVDFHLDIPYFQRREI